VGNTWPELHSGTNFNYVWDAMGLEWVKETQAGGGGGGGTVDQGASGSAGDPWFVTGAVTGPQTDVEARAYQTATGTITSNGQSVTLSLNGATGASVNFIDSSFDGTFKFYSSCDGGTTYIETQAFNTYGQTGGIGNNVSNVLQGGGITGARKYAFILTGGETHVRVTSVSGSSGSMAVVIKANHAAPNPVGLAIGPSEDGDYGRPVGGMFVVGRYGSTGIRSLRIAGQRYESNVPALVVLSRTATSNAQSITTVNDSSSDVQLIAQNVSRMALFITNTSSALLYVRLGSSAASATAFTKRLAQWETFPVPEYWIGEVRGIWATDPNDGIAIMQEITEP
jgi:hypothetical protein